MGENDKYLDLRGLVPGREERPKFEHSVDWSYGERRKGDRRQTERRQIEEDRIVQPEPTTRRSFLKFAAVAAATLTLGPSWRDSYSLQSLSPSDDLVTAIAKKARYDYDNVFHLQYDREGVVPWIALSSGKLIGTTPRNANSTNYVRTMKLLHEKTGDEKFLDAMLVFFAPMAEAPFEFGGGELEYQEYNNPSIARRHLISEVADHLMSYSGRLFPGDVRNIHQSKRNARYAQFAVWRMFQKDAMTFVGMDPHWKNMRLTADHALYLAPLMAASLHNIGGVLDPSTEIAPKSALEMKVASKRLCEHDIIDAAVIGLRTLMNATTRPDGMTNYQTWIKVVDGGVVYYNHELVTPEAKPNESYPVTARIQVQNAKGLQASVEAIDAVLGINPSSAHERRLVEVRNELLARGRVVSGVLADRLSIPTNRSHLNEYLSTETPFGQEGLLPEYVHKKGTLELQHPDLESTARAVGPLRFFGYENAVRHVPQELAALARKNIEKAADTTCRGETPLPFILPPASREADPMWNKAATARADLYALKYL